jgi:hypothetical protein
MRTVFFSCLFAALALPARADPPGANASAAPFTYSASGTCLDSPEGFNARLEPVYTGVAWTTSFASNGSVDDRGAASEVGQSVDSASFGVGPRMHAPAAHAYNSTFSASISESADDGAVFRAGAASGTFTAGPLAGKSFSLSGFELKRLARHDGDDVYGGAAPVTQTVSLAGGSKFERVCVLTVSVYPKR